jgi:hypothetical protein
MLFFTTPELGFVLLPLVPFLLQPPVINPTRSSPMIKPVDTSLRGFDCFLLISSSICLVAPFCNGVAQLKAADRISASNESKA